MASEQDNIELGRYLEVLLRRWWLVLLIPIVLGAAAYYQADSQTPLYRATEDILVQQARSGLIGLENTLGNEILATNYARTATTGDLLNQIQDELELTGQPVVKASGVGPILRISAENQDPLLARDIVSLAAELIILDVQTSKLVEIARLESLAAGQGVTVDREILQAQLSTFDSLRVIGSAQVPGSPFRPKPIRNAVLGAVLGLILGSGLAFLLEFLTKKIYSLSQIEKMMEATGLEPMPLGVIFHWRKHEINGSLLVSRDEPQGIYAEMFRTFRSAFQFVRSGALAGNKAFMITSASPMEGKTTMVSNLAVVLAQAGSSVILVDADLHKRSLYSIFGVQPPLAGENATGLSALLTGGTDCSLTEQLLDVGIPGLRLLPSGAVSGIPSDILAAPGAKAIFDLLKEDCDVLLVDAPPIMTVSDPLVLAGYVDGIVLAVNMNQTRSDWFHDSYMLLNRSGTPILGYVLNNVNSRNIGYGRQQYKHYVDYTKHDMLKTKGVP